MVTETTTESQVDEKELLRQDALMAEAREEGLRIARSARRDMEQELSKRTPGTYNFGVATQFKTKQDRVRFRKQMNDFFEAEVLRSDV